MKPVIRLFFRTLRIILGPFVLLYDWLVRPQGIVRPDAEQQAIDARTRQLALYHFPTCPFCLKTRRTIRRLSLKIELRDAQHDPAHRAAFIAATGKPQVPCLQIRNPNGQTTWMQDSKAIIAYLDREYATAAAA